MPRTNVRWRHVGEGIAVAAVGVAILALPILDTDDAQFPSGRMPLYLLGAGFVAAAIPAWLRLTRFGPVSVELLFAIATTFGSAIMLWLSWGPGTWTGGIPHLPDSWNHFLGNVIGTVMGVVLLLAAMFFWRTTLRGGWHLRRKH